MSALRRALAAGLVASVASAAGGSAALPPGVTAIDPPAAPGAAAPALAESPDGVVASWVEPTGRGAHRLRWARFDGAAWTPAATVVESPALMVNWADTPGLMVAGAGDGGWLAWWLERHETEPHAYSIALARSRDRGATWTSLGRLHEDRIAAEHGFVSMVPRRDGARAFWLDGREVPSGRPTALRVAEIGAEVGPSRVVDDSVCDCCPTTALETAEGRSLIAFRDRSPEELRDVSALRLDAASGAAAPSATPADGWRIAGCPVNGPALAGGAGGVALAWFAAPGERARVAVAFSRDDGRRFGDPIVVDDAQPIGRVGLRWLEGGDAAVIWLARAGDRGEVRLRRVRSDGRAGSPLALAPTGAGRTSGIPRLARLPDGRLLALWVDALAEPPRLRAARLEPAALAAP